jgi:hypothetical protein
VKNSPSLDRFDRIMMAFSVDYQSADKPGRGPGHKVRPSTRAKPRLEVLETRCLMSGLRPSIDPFDNPVHPIRAAAAATERFASHASPLIATIQPPPRVGSASEPSSLIEDGDSSNGATGSVLFSPPSLGFPEPPSDSYTVVLETKAPHDTLASAQVLPDLSFFGVVGTISTSATVDFYQLTLNEKAEELDFGLVFQQNGSIAPMEFQIFDGAGQLLGEWTSGGQGASILLAQLGPQAAGSTLYLGVSAGNSGGPAASSAGIGYQLWVSLQTGPEQTAGAPQESSTLPTATLSPLPAGTLTPLAALGTASAPGLPAAGAAVPTSSALGLAVAGAVGSPAIRTGRPSVEALSSGESDRSTDREFDAVVHQDVGEHNLASSTIEQKRASDPSSQSEPEPDADALVAMNGPGGFALLGAVAMGHRPRSRAATATGADLVATPPAEEPAPGIVAEGIAPCANIVVTNDQALAEDRSIGVRLRDGVPNSLLSALGLAIVFTLNAALSQPLAGFDYLASRFDANRGKLRRRRNQGISGDRPWSCEPLPTTSTRFGGRAQASAAIGPGASQGNRRK